MAIVRAGDVPATGFGEPAKDVQGRVLIGRAAGAENFCMRMFEVAPGGHTPRHTRAWEHEIFVHEGAGEVWLDGAWHAVEPGDAVFIPPEAGHQIRCASASPLVFVCLVPPAAPEL